MESVLDLRTTLRSQTEIADRAREREGVLGPVLTLEQLRPVRRRFVVLTCSSCSGALCWCFSPGRALDLFGVSFRTPFPISAPAPAAPPPPYLLSANSVGPADRTTRERRGKQFARGRRGRRPPSPLPVPAVHPRGVREEKMGRVLLPDRDVATGPPDGWRTQGGSLFA